MEIKRFPKKVNLPPSRSETTNRSISIGISVSQTIDDPTSIEIVRAHLHLHHVANGDFDEMLTQFPGDMGKNLMPIFQFHAKHGAGQNCNNLTLDLDIFFGSHKIMRKILLIAYIKKIKNHVFNIRQASMPTRSRTFPACERWDKALLRNPNARNRKGIDYLPL